jgi:hypothetical protein
VLLKCRAGNHLDSTETAGQVSSSLKHRTLRACLLLKCLPSLALCQLFNASKDSEEARGRRSLRRRIDNQEFCVSHSTVANMASIPGSLVLTCGNNLVSVVHMSCFFIITSDHIIERQKASPYAVTWCTRFDFSNSLHAIIRSAG